MVVAILILLVVLFGGPTAYLFQSFIYAIGDYLIQLVPMSFKTYAYTPAGSWNWFHGWTLTYLIWWLAWGPFVGIFIARISRGRTIREFVIYVVGVPTLVSMLWFAAFGGAAIHIEMFGAGGITEKVFADVAGALFAFFEYFPGTTLLNFLAVCLIFIFLVTSADSGTFVISMMTSKGSLNPQTKLMFGHVRGAFTDARSERKGLFLEAQGGTLLLDELGDMPLAMQVKLLRALEENQLRPVGSDRDVEFDVRVLAATHRDLETAVEEGRFRQDLFYRINVIQMHLPPLRSRPHTGA